MKPSPDGWPRLSAALFYADPRAAIAWLERAFGFTTRLVVDGPGGRVLHSELTYGEAVVMVAGAGPDYQPADGPQPWRTAFAAPGQLDGRTTQSIALYIDDADRHCEHARAHGAEILSEPQDTDYGPDYWCDRNYAARDCDGHVWWFMQRVSTQGVAHT